MQRIQESYSIFHVCVCVCVFGVPGYDITANSPARLCKGSVFNT